MKMMRRGLTSSIGNLSKYNKARLAVMLAKRAYGAYKSYRGTRNQSTNEKVVSNQYDFTTQYRRKRMPRGKRKRWVKFVKKVGAVENRLLGLRTVVFNDKIDIAYGGVANGQGWGVMHLYGRTGLNTGNVENGSADLLEIFNNDPELKDNFTGALVQTDASVQFRSATIDITMFNNTSRTAEVDVYKIWYKPNEIQFNSFSQANQDYELTQQAITGGISGQIRLTTRGATPFAMPQLLQRLRATIVWKKKFILGASQCSLFQHRDPKNHYLHTRDMKSSDTDLTMRGMTCSYLFITKDVARTGDDLTLSVSASRTYSYKTQLKTINNSRNQVL